jgi:hypothetical protein
MVVDRVAVDWACISVPRWPTDSILVWGLGCDGRVVTYLALAIDFDSVNPSMSEKVEAVLRLISRILENLLVG